MTSPIESPITCEQFADALPEFLEREVDEATRARMELHAVRCDECGPLLADLRRLRIDAANLPELTPSRDLWSGIAARIETPVVELTPGGRWTGGPVERSNAETVERRRLSPLWAGLAAAGIIAVTATITYELTTRTITVLPQTTVAASSPSVQPVPALADTARAAVDSTVPAVNGSTVSPSVALASNKLTAEQTYDAEIKRLRVIVASRRASLDTTTIAVIEKNLKVIDDAIAQCRAALKADPASRYLLESLNDALDTKVQLLRTAATLPSRT